MKTMNMCDTFRKIREKSLKAIVVLKVLPEFFRQSKCGTLCRRITQDEAEVSISMLLTNLQHKGGLVMLISLQRMEAAANICIMKFHCISL